MPRTRAPIQRAAPCHSQCLLQYWRQLTDLLIYFLSMYTKFHSFAFLLSSSKPRGILPVRFHDIQGKREQGSLSIQVYVLFDLRSFSAFLSHFLPPNPKVFQKTSVFLKTQMFSFFFSTPTEKIGNTRCEIFLIPICPPLNNTPPTTAGSLLVSFRPFLSSQGSFPTICVSSSPTARCTPRNIASHTENDVPSSVLSQVMSKEQFSQPGSAQLKKGLRTKRKQVYYKERGKKKNLKGKFDMFILQ